MHDEIAWWNRPPYKWEMIGSNPMSCTSFARRWEPPPHTPHSLSCGTLTRIVCLGTIFERRDRSGITASKSQGVLHPTGPKHRMIVLVKYWIYSGSDTRPRWWNRLRTASTAKVPPWLYKYGTGVIARGWLSFRCIYFKPASFVRMHTCFRRLMAKAAAWLAAYRGSSPCGSTSLQEINMSIVGVIWLVLIILKIVGVIATSWVLLIFWPIILFLVLALIFLVFGVSIAGVSAFVSR